MQEDTILAEINADSSACYHCPFADGCCQEQGCNIPSEEVPEV